ncbi:unnamed protein product, partial [Rhizoctonia solani]
MQETNAIPPITTQVDAHRAISPLPHRVSWSGSEAMSKAGSQTGSQAESQADTWAELVGWDDQFRELKAYEDRPEVKKLKEVVAKSFTVPAWLADLKSPKCTYFAGIER